MPKLYDIPKGSKIYGLQAFVGGSRIARDAVIIFDHVDGMYSYCTIEGAPEAGPVHLNATTPLEAFKDGYKVAEETE